MVNITTMYYLRSAVINDIDEVAPNLASFACTPQKGFDFHRPFPHTILESTEVL